VSGVTLTRVANSCVLLDFDGEFVLTDPYFTERWHLHRGEPLGMTIGELPRLSAIVATNYFPNHWDTRALAQFAHRVGTRVFTSTDRMERSARELGFTDVVRARWGEEHPITDRLRVEVVEAHSSPVGDVNNYVLTTDSARVFFGGEARTLEPLREYRSGHAAVDVALLPVNGLHVAVTGPQIVMDGDTALEGARILGARSLVAVHDAYGRDPLWSFIRRRGSGELARSHAGPEDPEVVLVPPGRPWACSVDLGPFARPAGT
jgi:L-ascorbate metabolism protein UlaG (beta-lactamase superfamily)